MIRLPRACRERTAVRFPTNNSHMCCVELAPKALALAGQSVLYTGCPRSLMSRNRGKTAVHDCLCLRDMAVRMREVLARPWVGACVPLALSLNYFQGNFRLCNRIRFNLFFLLYFMTFLKNSTARAYR